MPLKIASLAFKELKYSARSLRLVVVILFLGFIGPLTVSAIRTSVASDIIERSRGILSADLSVSAVRPFKPDERESLKKILRPAREAEEIEFPTMARSEKATAMVELHAVGPTYPVFGGFKIKGENGIFTGSRLDRLEGKDDGGRQRVADGAEAERVAWVFPDVLAQLDLKVGETIRLGKSEFKVRAVLDDAPGVSRIGMGLAPRVFIAKRFAEGTGLLRSGSQIFYRFYVELPRGANPDIAAASVKKTLADPDVFLRTPGDSIQGLERFFTFFNSYLVVIAMAVFALSWGSAYYILQVYLEERLRNAAVLLVSGASRAYALILYSAQIFAVLIAALGAASLVAMLLIDLVRRLAGDLLPENFILKISGADFLSMALVAAVSVIAFLVPLFAKLYTARLGELLGENVMAPSVQVRRSVAALAPALAIAIFFALSIWLMGSVGQAARLMGGIGLVVASGWSFGRVVFRGFFQLRRRRPGIGRLVATNLARGRFGTNLGFLTLLLVSLILNLLPHLLSSVEAEVRPLNGRDVPALFLFNIPESSVEEVRSLVEKNLSELRFVSPMILARLSGVNGRAPESDSFQRFPVRISYRASRIPSEALVEGHDFSGPFDSAKEKLPFISMEQRFAERNGFKLGDELEFDVQGVPVTGKVANFRRVRWSDFNPNFFMLFQTGVLEDAPKTFLANVVMGKGNSSEGTSASEREAAKVRLQYELIRAFPELSVIDIGRTVAKVIEVVNAVILPLEAAAWFAMALSFFILFAVVAHNLRLRKGELEIEKLLGADARLIRGIIVREYAWTAFFAWLTGAAGAAAIATVVAKEIFDIAPDFAWRATALSSIVVIGLTVIIARTSVHRVLGLRGAFRT